MVEAEVLLVQKRRRLMKAGENPPTKENVAAEDTGLVRKVAQQGGSEPRAREGSAVLETIWAVESGEEEQAVLPLVLVLFEAVLEEEPKARNKQETKARKL